MYKLLLVDDEKLEMRYTRKIVEENLQEVKIVGEVLNGEEAIERCRSLKPDIIFMDVKMPGMDGLIATRAIKEICPETKTVIITAYDEFEFACEALKLGASDYLLKPVSKREILNVLRFLIQRIQAERLRKKEEEKAQLQLNQNLPFIEAGFVLDMIMGNQSYEDFADENPFNISLTPTAVFVVEKPKKIHWDIEEPQSAPPNYESFASILTKEIHRYKDCLHARIGENRFAIVVGGIFANEKKPYHLAEKIQKAMAQHGWQLFCGVGRMVPDPSSLNFSFKEALQALNFAVLNGGNPVQHYDTISRWKKNESNYPKKQEQALENSIRKNELREFEQGLSSFMKEILSSQRNTEKAKFWTLKLIISLCRTAEEIWDKSEALGQLTLVGVENVLSSQSALDLEGHVLYWGKKFVKTVKNLQDELDSDVISKAVSFLERNYHESLSLEDVANYVHFSPFHFSRVFKQKTGTAFLEYLTKVRIANAKILLRNTDIPVAEVGKKVGYPDPNYFSRVFRKIEGIAPSQYRKVFADINDSGSS